jgi:hypothetical protein
MIIILYYFVRLRLELCLKKQKITYIWGNGRPMDHAGKPIFPTLILGHQYMLVLLPRTEEEKLQVDNINSQLYFGLPLCLTNCTDKCAILCSVSIA